MKILHSADWHLDFPLVGRSEAQAASLKAALMKIPDQVLTLCKNECCALLPLAGDLFDGKPREESVRGVCAARAEGGVSVVIAPGDLDCCRPVSAYLSVLSPEDVCISTNPLIEALKLLELD